jgi:hypothetical protein
MLRVRIHEGICRMFEDRECMVDKMVKNCV